MDLNKILHRISHLKWLFLAAQVGLIAYCFIALPENLITLIGVLIYVSGIYLGLESLSDIERMTAKEITRFQTESHAKKQIKFLLICIGFLGTISVFFMSLKFAFDERKIFNELFSVGLDCWALLKLG